MSNKKRNTKNQKQNFPFANEIKMMKADFKNKIDKMSDEEWEEEAEKFYSKEDNKSNNIVQFNNDDLPF